MASLYRAILSARRGRPAPGAAAGRASARPSWLDAIDDGAASAVGEHQLNRLAAAQAVGRARPAIRPPARRGRSRVPAAGRDSSDRCSMSSAASLSRPAPSRVRSPASAARQGGQAVRSRWCAWRCNRPGFSGEATRARSRSWTATLRCRPAPSRLGGMSKRWLAHGQQVRGARQPARGAGRPLPAILDDAARRSASAGAHSRRWRRAVRPAPAWPSRPPPSASARDGRRRSRSGWCRSRARRPRSAGWSLAATMRARASSLKAHRSSTDPPPRATIRTSGRGWAPAHGVEAAGWRR